ncbi:MAG: MbcA/ParS/Xre antitoxin family protein [Vulcanimicrobiaceae bacterium]
MPKLLARSHTLDPQPALTPAAVAARASELSGPALRGFFAIAGVWQLSRREQQAMLGLADSTYYAYRKRVQSARISRDTLERISYVLGIFKAINILLPRAEAADGWVRRPNDAFGGQSALERMTSGNVADLYVVRRYLDGERGA